MCPRRTVKRSQESYRYKKAVTVARLSTRAHKCIVLYRYQVKNEYLAFRCKLNQRCAVLWASWTKGSNYAQLSSDLWDKIVSITSFSASRLQH